MSESAFDIENILKGNLRVNNVSRRIETELLKVRGVEKVSVQYIGRFDDSSVEINIRTCTTHTPFHKIAAAIEKIRRYLIENEYCKYVKLELCPLRSVMSNEQAAKRGWPKVSHEELMYDEFPVCGYCGRKTSSAASNYFDADGRPTECYVAFDGVWMKGCAYDRCPPDMKKFVDHVLACAAESIVDNKERS